MLDTTDNTRESDTCQVMNGSDRVSVAEKRHVTEDGWLGQGCEVANVTGNLFVNRRMLRRAGEMCRVTHM